MNAVMYYAIGLPLGVVLTFLVGMGIMGTWCGGRGAGPSDANASPPPCPAGLWLGMLVCVILATAAFGHFHTARMDWKRAAEEVSALPVTKETMPDTILSTPPYPRHKPPSRGLPMTPRASCDLGKGTDRPCLSSSWEHF